MKTSDKLQFGLQKKMFVFFSLKTVPNFSGSISGIKCEQNIILGGVLAPDGVVLAPDGPVLAPDGVVLAPDGPVLALDGEVLALDGKVLATGWCSTGSRMVQYWPTDGSILIRKCCRKSLGQFREKKTQTAGCVDQTETSQKFSFLGGIPL